MFKIRLVDKIYNKLISIKRSKLFFIIFFILSTLYGLLKYSNYIFSWMLSIHGSSNNVASYTLEGNVITKLGWENKSNPKVAIVWLNIDTIDNNIIKVRSIKDVLHDSTSSCYQLGVSNFRLANNGIFRFKFKPIESPPNVLGKKVNGLIIFVGNLVVFDDKDNNNLFSYSEKIFTQKSYGICFIEGAIPKFNGLKEGINVINQFENEINLNEITRIDTSDLTIIVTTGFKKKQDLSKEIEKEIIKNSGHKNTISLLPFKILSENHEYDWLTEGIPESLISSFNGNNGELILVERILKNDILKEIDFEQSIYVDKKTAIKLGKLLGTDYAVVGSCQIIGNKLIVNARIIDLELGLINPCCLISQEGLVTEIFKVEDSLSHKLKKCLKTCL